MITIINPKEIEKANVVTHGGKFHADDVLATILLSKIFPELKVCRTFRIPDQLRRDVIVYEIGGGIYDHHQKTFNEARKNGIKYSAFGLLWKKYGMQLLSGIPNAKLVFDTFDTDFVTGIDASDNGQTNRSDVPILTVSGVMGAFNPTWDQNGNVDECFARALSVAEIIFDNALNGAISKAKAKAGVEIAINQANNGIMVLSEFLPWQQHIFSSTNPNANSILYVIFPSNREGYNVYAVPEEPGSRKQRKPLPSTWAGLQGDAFAEISGVPTANFCHPARFICGADSLDDAMELAKKAVEA